MNRRETLKSIGAFLVGPSLMKTVPVTFRAEKPQGTNLELALRRFQVFQEPLHELGAYKTALLGPDGQVWQGPQVLDVTRDHEKCSVHFQIQQLQAKEAMTLYGIRLFNRHGSWTIDCQWAGGILHLGPGDQFNCNVTCAIESTRHWTDSPEGLPRALDPRFVDCTTSPQNCEP